MREFRRLYKKKRVTGQEKLGARSCRAPIVHLK